MKMVSRLFALGLGFGAGLFSGALIMLATEIASSRPGTFGGEGLILPLIVFLIYFGYYLGRETKLRGRFLQAYNEGYQEGYHNGQRDTSKRVTLYPKGKAQGQ